MVLLPESGNRLRTKTAVAQNSSRE
jgi:hypothetical protein